MWLLLTVHTVTAWRADADTQTLIEKKIRDKSAFTGVRITLKPGQHQGTPHTSLLTLIFSESSPIGLEFTSFLVKEMIQ